jgi:hypothetical protein
MRREKGREREREREREEVVVERRRGGMLSRSCNVEQTASRCRARKSRLAGR